MDVILKNEMHTTISDIPIIMICSVHALSMREYKPLIINCQSPWSETALKMSMKPITNPKSPTSASGLPAPSQKPEIAENSSQHLQRWPPS